MIGIAFCDQEHLFRKPLLSPAELPEHFPILYRKKGENVTFSLGLILKATLAMTFQTASRVLKTLILILCAVCLCCLNVLEANAKTQPPPALLPYVAQSQFEAKIHNYTSQGDVILSDNRVLTLAALSLTPQNVKALERDYPRGTLVVVSLWQSQPDRWGRLIGDMVRLGKDVPLPSAHENLLTQGEALVHPRHIVPYLCITEFKHHEKYGRDQRLGLWADDKILLNASQPDDVLKHKGSYRVIEGVIASIGERRYVTYLNFGEHWTHDTTVSIPEKIWQSLQEQGLTKTTLRAKRVRFRGVIEERAGPLITLTHPEDFDVLDEKEMK
jgi:hypothetical protein